MLNFCKPFLPNNSRCGILVLNMAYYRVDAARSRKAVNDPSEDAMDQYENYDTATLILIIVIPLVAISVIALVVIICCWRRWLCFKVRERQGIVLSAPPQDSPSASRTYTAQRYTPVPSVNESQSSFQQA